MPVGMKESPEKVSHIFKSSAASSFRLLLSFMAVREKKNEKTPGSVGGGEAHRKKKTHVSFVLQMFFLSFRVAS